MNDEIKNLLESVRRGEVSVDEAYLKLRTAPFRDLGFAKIDTHRRGALIQEGFLFRHS